MLLSTSYFEFGTFGGLTELWGPLCWPNEKLPFELGIMLSFSSLHPPLQQVLFFSRKAHHPITTSFAHIVQWSMIKALSTLRRRIMKMWSRAHRKWTPNDDYFIKTQLWKKNVKKNTCTPVGIPVIYPWINGGRKHFISLGFVCLLSFFCLVKTNNVFSIFFWYFECWIVEFCWVFQTIMKSF